MKAYSVDLREKIAAAVGRGMSKAQAAARTFGSSGRNLRQTRYVKLLFTRPPSIKHVVEG